MNLKLINKIGLALSCCVWTLSFAGLAGAQTNTSKIVGINDHVIWRTNADQDKAFAAYGESGTKFLRVGADWNALQSEKPAQPTDSLKEAAYNSRYLPRIDYFFQKCTVANIRVLLTPAYAPTWATGAETKNQGGWAPSPEHLGAYADFCEFLLRRYTAPAYINGDGKHTLEAIEIWNEPNLADAFFKPYSRNDAAGATNYGNMVVTAGGRIKSVRGTIGASDVLVLAPAMSQVHEVCWAPKGKTTWMDAFYAVPNVTDNYDVFAWHTYWESSGSAWLPAELPDCWNPANQRQAVLGKLIAPEPSEIWAKMVAHGDDLKPNWCTEIGGASKSDTADHKASFLSFAEQKAHLEDAITTLRSGQVNKLDRIYWYEIFDEPHGGKAQAFYGLLACNDSKPIVYNGGMALADVTFSPKPAYATYKNADKGEVMGPKSSVKPQVISNVTGR